MGLRILHIAPLNVAGVPFAMMDMQKRFGHTARLVTLHRNGFGFPEDVCLDLPLPRGHLADAWRRKKIRAWRNTQAGKAPILKPRNILERLYWRFDDAWRAPAIRRAVIDHGLDAFDIIHYDGAWTPSAMHASQVNGNDRTKKSSAITWEATSGTEASIPTWTGSAT